MTVERGVQVGDDLDFRLTGFAPGSTVQLTLERERGRRPVTAIDLDEVLIGPDGSAAVAVPITADISKGVYKLVAHTGDLRVEERVVIRKAPKS